MLLDIRQHVTFTDFFVICTGTSERQLHTLDEAIDLALTRSGAELLHREGTTESGWILHDYGDVIVHIMAPAERDYYRLERLWGDIMPMVRIL